jgi:hypothetical protein
MPGERVVHSSESVVSDWTVSWTFSSSSRRANALVDADVVLFTEHSFDCEGHLVKIGRRDADVLR